MTHDPQPGAAIDLDPDGIFRLKPEVVVASLRDEVLLYGLDDDRTLALSQNEGVPEMRDGGWSTARIRELMQQVSSESLEDLRRGIGRTLPRLIRRRALESVVELSHHWNPQPVSVLPASTRCSCAIPATESRLSACVSPVARVPALSEN